MRQFRYARKGMYLIARLTEAELPKTWEADVSPLTTRQSPVALRSRELRQGPGEVQLCSILRHELRHRQMLPEPPKFTAIGASPPAIVGVQSALRSSANETNIVRRRMYGREKQVCHTLH